MLELSELKTISTTIVVIVEVVATTMTTNHNYQKILTKKTSSCWTSWTGNIMIRTMKNTTTNTRTEQRNKH